MKKERALEIKSLIAVYGTLVIAAMLFDYFSNGHPFWAWKQSRLQHPGTIIFGFFFAVLYILVAWVTPRLFRWGIELEKLFSQVLTPLSYFQMINLSIISGFVEEWFFRGILMNHFGWILSSIIFGLCHFIPARSVWRWSIISLIAGLVLGGIYHFSQSLWLVAILHASINGVLIFKLNQTRVASPSLT
jgi:membrane protease YdiL (CAAX protease family)